MFYKDMKSINDTMKKRKTTFFTHLMRTSEDRLTNQKLNRMGRLRKQKKPSIWIRAVKEDITELDLTLEDFAEKTRNCKKI